MKRTNLLLTSCFVGLIAPGLASANLIWHQYNGSEYALTSTWNNWADAEAEAISQGGNLVTINDSAENTWLANTFVDTYSRAASLNNTLDPMLAAVWIGYRYDSNQNAWGWSSGETSAYTNLHGTFPEGGSKAYLHTSTHPYATTWNAHYVHDTNFDLNLKGVIERSVDAPTTLLTMGLGLLGIAAMQRKKRAQRA